MGAAAAKCMDYIFKKGMIKKGLMPLGMILQDLIRQIDTGKFSFTPQSDRSVMQNGLK